MTHWPRETCCIGHEKPWDAEELRPGSCLELQLTGKPCALCPCCAQLSLGRGRGFRFFRG